MHFCNAQNPIKLTESQLVNNYIYNLKQLEIGNDSLDKARSILGAPTFLSRNDNGTDITYVFNIIPDHITNEIAVIKNKIDQIDKNNALIEARIATAVHEYRSTPNFGYQNTELYGGNGSSPEMNAAVIKYTRRMDEYIKNQNQLLKLKDNSNYEIQKLKNTKPDIAECLIRFDSLEKVIEVKMDKKMDNGAETIYHRGGDNNGNTINIKSSNQINQSNANNILSSVYTIIPSSGTAPNCLSEGQIYYNSSDKHAYLWNGTEWLQLDNAKANPQKP